MYRARSVRLEEMELAGRSRSRGRGWRGFLASSAGRRAGPPRCSGRSRLRRLVHEPDGRPRDLSLPLEARAPAEPLSPCEPPVNKGLKRVSAGKAGRPPVTSQSRAGFAVTFIEVRLLGAEGAPGRIGPGAICGLEGRRSVRRSTGARAHRRAQQLHLRRTGRALDRAGAGAAVDHRQGVRPRGRSWWTRPRLGECPGQNHG